ncbi:MAG TPA: efflux RND transporter periplasmic adaptor subunit [Pirellulaceae bacterium]|nr:efflux RND transporter periplasmic adaptor subunit [Pirellulaceae bacterium]HMO93102.1 efflux RND transporter periplasmic adaptor subunit [Pirellulaceae bacterium]HMP69947.1 efflux RND transporter periplasmic adaptor subunit [Pirellulaceae bacterium]
MNEFKYGSPMIPADQPNQWMNLRAKLRSELKIDVRQDHVFIEDPLRQKFFSIGHHEHQVLARMDGQSPLSESLKAHSETSHITPEMAKQVVQWAIQNNLLTSREHDFSKRIDQQAKVLNRQKWIGRLNPICIKLPLFNPDRLLSRARLIASALFSRGFVGVWLLVGLYAAFLAWVNWDRLGSASIGILAEQRWLWMIGIWVALKAIHEAAHGLACKKYGGEVKEAGVLLLLFAPLAYTDCTSSWRFPSAWQRIVVAAAGMYVELFVAFLAMIMWARLEPGLLSDICFQIVLMASVTTLLFNINPLMRFDGYFILMDSIRIPNLYTKGTRWTQDRILHWTLGLPLTPNLCAKRETLAVAIYGVLSTVWKILISFSLIIAASVMFHGGGKILAAVAVVLWFVLPAIQHLRKLCEKEKRVQIRYGRVALNLALAVALVLGMILVPAPSQRSAPAIVDFRDETVVRAAVDGFLVDIRIQNGDRLQKGETLAVLNNPQLDAEIAILEHHYQTSLIRSRMHQQARALALAQAELDTLQGLEKQIQEKNLQRAELTIKAPCDGIVVQRDLETRLHGYVKRGEALLSLVSENDKKILAMVNQRHGDAWKNHRGNVLRVLVPGRPDFFAEVVRIEPRASDETKQVALCANVGGPLPVRLGAVKNGYSEYRLLEPHILVELHPDSTVSSDLRSGQRGRLAFAATWQSLGSYLFMSVERWVQEKIEMAMRVQE